MGAKTINTIELAQGLWDRLTKGDESAGFAATKSQSSPQDVTTTGAGKVFEEAQQALTLRLQPVADHPVLRGTAKVFKQVSGQVETKVKLDHLARKLIALDKKIAGLKAQIAELENPNLFSELALSFEDEESAFARGVELSSLRQEYQGLQQDYVGLRRQIEKVALQGMDGASFYERNFHVAKTFERIGDPDAAAFYYRQILTIRPQLSEVQYATVAHALASLSFAKSLGSSRELSAKPGHEEAEKLLAAVVRNLSDNENQNRQALYGLLADPLVRDEALSWISRYYDVPLAQLQLLRARLLEAQGKLEPAAVLLLDVSERDSKNPEVKPYAAEARLHQAQLLFARGGVDSGHRVLNQVVATEQDPNVVSLALVMQGMQMATAGKREEAMQVLRGIQSDYPGSRGDILLRSSPLFKEVRSGLGFMEGDPKDLLPEKTSPAQKAMSISLSVAMLVPAARAVGWTSRLALEGAELAFGKESIAYALTSLGLTAAQPLATYTLYQAESSLLLDQPFRWEAGEAMRFAGGAALGGVMGRLDLGRRVATLPLFTSTNARLYPVNAGAGVIDYTSRAGQIAGRATDVAVNDGAMLLAANGPAQDPLDYLGGRLLGSAVGRVASGAMDRIPRLPGLTRGSSDFVVGGREFVQEQNALVLYGAAGSASLPPRRDLVGLSLFLEGETALSANEIPVSLFDPEQLAANGPWTGDNVLVLPVSYPALAEYSLQLAAGAEELSDSPYVAGGMVPGVTVAMGQGEPTRRVQHSGSTRSLGSLSGIRTGSASSIPVESSEVLATTLGLFDVNRTLAYLKNPAFLRSFEALRVNAIKWGLSESDFTSLEQFTNKLNEAMNEPQASEMSGSITQRFAGGKLEFVYGLIEKIHGNPIYKYIRKFDDALADAELKLLPLESALLSFTILEKVGRDFEMRVVGLEQISPENILFSATVNPASLISYELRLPGPESLAKLISVLAQNRITIKSVTEKEGVASFCVQFTRQGRTEEGLLIVSYSKTDHADPLSDEPQGQIDPVKVALAQTVRSESPDYDYSGDSQWGHQVIERPFGLSEKILAEVTLLDREIDAGRLESQLLKDVILSSMPESLAERAKSLMLQLEENQRELAGIYRRLSDIEPSLVQNEPQIVAIKSDFEKNDGTVANLSKEVISLVKEQGSDAERQAKLIKIFHQWKSCVRDLARLTSRRDYLQSELQRVRARHQEEQEGVELLRSDSEG